MKILKIIGAMIILPFVIVATVFLKWMTRKLKAVNRARRWKGMNTDEMTADIVREFKVPRSILGDFDSRYKNGEPEWLNSKPPVFVDRFPRPDEDIPEFIKNVADEQDAKRCGDV